MALAHVLILGLGGLLVGIPILLHLLMQPKPKSYKFPALRFVKQMQSSNQRSLNLRHWLLLLLRCLLLLVLAAALAKPSTVSSAFGNWLGVGIGGVLSLLVGLLLMYALVWSKPANLPLAIVVGLVLALLLSYTGYTLRSAISKDSRHILADQQAPVGAVILVDNSPRLGYRRENRTLLEKVQDHGRWLIGQLPLNSKVAVMESGDEYPFFSVDVSAARKRLNTLDLNFSAEPIPASLEKAIQFLADTEFERKEIYVFSDLSRVSWTHLGDSLSRALQQHPDVNLFVIDAGVVGAAELFVGGIEPVGKFHSAAGGTGAEYAGAGDWQRLGSIAQTVPGKARSGPPGTGRRQDAGSGRPLDTGHECGGGRQRHRFQQAGVAGRLERRCASRLD